MVAKDITEVTEILDRLETCVVLRSEHGLIKSEPGWRPNPGLPGGWWQRYEGKIVRVNGPNVR